MRISPQLPKLIRSGFIACLSVAPAWGAEEVAAEALQKVPEPAASLLGLFGLCLLLLRRGKP
jgi:hypothetical protein